MRVLIIRNNIVDNVIDAESVAQATEFFPDALCLDGENGGNRFDIYDPVTGTFSAPVVPFDLSAAQAIGVRNIDSDADYVYGAVLGNRALEYAQAEADAHAYCDAGYTGDVPSSVQSWATAKATDAQWAADDILSTAAAWRGAQEAIRQHRLAGKEAIRNAADAEALVTAVTTWSTFFAYIKGELGID